MKKIIFGIITLVFALPISVNALSATNSVSCTPAKIKTGDTVTCTFKSNITEGKLTGFSALYDLGEGVSYVSESFNDGSTLPVLAANNNGFNLMKASGVSGNITLGTARFTVNGNAGNYKIGLKNIDLSDENAASSTGTNISTTVRIASSVNTLNSLEIAPIGYEVDKITNVVKNGNIVTSANVDGDKIVINAVKTDSNSTLNGTGEKALKYGNNTFTIKVTAENGDVKNYVVNINRLDTRSTNNYLKSLTIKESAIKYDKNILEYKIRIGYDVEKINITAVADDLKSKIEIIGNDKLKVGNNEILIKVTAENETVKTYKIIAEKASALVAVPSTLANSPLMIISLIIILISGSVLIYCTNGERIKKILKKR